MRGRSLRDNLICAILARDARGVCIPPVALPPQRQAKKVTV